MYIIISFFGKANYHIGLLFILDGQSMCIQKDSLAENGRSGRPLPGRGRPSTSFCASFVYLSDALDIIDYDICADRRLLFILDGQSVCIQKGYLAENGRIYRPPRPVGEAHRHCFTLRLCSSLVVGRHRCLV